MNTIKALILASGNGSNAENLLRFSEERPDILQVCGVATDRPEAGIIKRSQNLGRECRILPAKNKAQHEEDLLAYVRSSGAEWLCLCGYMRLLSPAFIQKFYIENKGHSQIINIHPALLPSFPGINSYAQAFNYGVAVSGVTLHLVDQGVDTGPILLQRSFPRLLGDRLEDFKARGLALEYEVYRQGLSYLAQGLLVPETTETGRLRFELKGAL